MNPQIHLIDGNALGFAAAQANFSLKVGDKPTGATYGLIRTLRNIQVEFPNSKKIVLWDGKAKWRFDLYPDYKSKRQDTADKRKLSATYKAQTEDINRAFTLLGVDQVRSPTCEADDLAAAYVAAFEHKGWKTRLVTSDKDWLQLVSANTDWWDPVRIRHCAHDTFQSFTTFTDTVQFLDAKCLIGDTSDKIKGVGRIGESGARDLLRAHHSVANFLRRYQMMSERMDGLPKAWLELAENVDGKQDRYWRNRKLMELKPGLPGVSDKKITKGQLDVDGFRAFCEDLAFMSIVSNFEQWIEPFLRRQTT